MTLAGPVPALAGEPAGPAVTPTPVAGNPSCEDLGYAHGSKWNYPADSTGGTYPLGTGSVTWSTNGTYVNWTSTIGVDAVIVKGGPNANKYVYDPPTESRGDQGLVSPTNANNGKPYGLSRVEFCYDYELAVTKTAATSFTRSYAWTVEKTSPVTTLTLAEGQTATGVQYGVTVSDSSTDSNWRVTGDITILNPDPTLPAKVTGVTDTVSGPPGIPASVTCPALPVTLAPGASIVCTYSAALPDGAARVNSATATVDATSKVKGGSGTAAVTFGNPTTLVDECVEVKDDKGGTSPVVLGSVCADKAPKTFSYAMDIGPYATCGQYAFTNTAHFKTNDTRTTGSDSHTIAVSVTCKYEGGDGCTLTQGYWKTHSEHGPAPYDDTWALLTNGADTAFFDSGMTYHKVMRTPPKGNAYFILAKQYVAAVLNGLNGADQSDIQSTLDAAEALFDAQGTNDVTLTKAETKKAKSLASILDKYNNGKIGPGHCSA